MPDKFTPDQALAQLLRGNERFVAGWPDHPNQSARRRREFFGWARLSRESVCTALIPDRILSTYMV